MKEGTKEVVLLPVYLSENIAWWVMVILAVLLWHQNSAQKGKECLTNSFTTAITHRRRKMFDLGGEMSFLFIRQTSSISVVTTKLMSQL